MTTTDPEIRELTLDEIETVSGGATSITLGFWGAKATITSDGNTTCTSVSTSGGTSWQCDTKVH